MSEVSQTKFKLKSFQSSMANAFDNDCTEKKVYTGAHNDGKVIYDFEVVTEKDRNGFSAKIFAGQPVCESEFDCLSKLSEWLKKASMTIDNQLNSGNGGES